MRIRTATDLGAFIRERRTKLGMDQVALAEAAGTSRKWIIEVEQGKPRAEIGLLLRTLKTLRLSIDLKIEPSPAASTNSETKAGDINSVLKTVEEASMTNELIALLDGREVGNVSYRTQTLIHL